MADDPSTDDKSHFEFTSLRYVSYSLHACSLFAGVGQDQGVMRMKLMNKGMRVWRSAWLAGTAVVIGSVGGDALAAPLPGKPDDVHTRFNEAAHSVRADTRMSLTECAGVVCNYVVSGNLGGLAEYSDEKPEELESFSLIFAKGSDANSLLLAMGLLMMVFSPESERDERGEALNRIAGSFGSSKGDTTVLIGDVSYRLANLKLLGLWFTVSRD